jgi:hypothetical protein
MQLISYNFKPSGIEEMEKKWKDDYKDDNKLNDYFLNFRTGEHFSQFVNYWEKDMLKVGGYPLNPVNLRFNFYLPSTDSERNFIAGMISPDFPNRDCAGFVYDEVKNNWYVNVPLTGYGYMFKLSKDFNPDLVE